MKYIFKKYIFAITVYVCLYEFKGGGGSGSVGLARIIYIINKKIMSRSDIFLVVAFRYLVFFLKFLWNKKLYI